MRGEYGGHARDSHEDSSTVRSRASCDLYRGGTIERLRRVVECRTWHTNRLVRVAVEVNDQFVLTRAARVDSLHEEILGNSSRDLSIKMNVSAQRPEEPGERDIPG